MKQDPFAGVYRARTPKELAEMFMNPHAPKTEAEHWAVREIEKLRAEVERMRAVLSNISQYETSAPAGFEWDIVVEELVEIARKALDE